MNFRMMKNWLLLLTVFFLWLLWHTTVPVLTSWIHSDPVLSVFSSPFSLTTLFSWWCFPLDVTSRRTSRSSFYSILWRRTSWLMSDTYWPTFIEVYYQLLDLEPWFLIVSWKSLYVICIYIDILYYIILYMYIFKENRKCRVKKTFFIFFVLSCIWLVNLVQSLLRHGRGTWVWPMGRFRQTNGRFRWVSPAVRTSTTGPLQWLEPVPVGGSFQRSNG
jgi:hypothetical protein